MYRYEIILYWSAEDAAFIAEATRTRVPTGPQANSTSSTSK